MVDKISYLATFKKVTIAESSEGFRITYVHDIPESEYPKVLRMPLHKDKLTRVEISEVDDGDS